MSSRELTRTLRSLPASVGVLLLTGALNGCNETNEAVACDPGVGRSVQPTEWVGFHTEVPLVPGDFQPLASGLFGPDAQGGQFVVDREITPGVFITSAAELSTPEQARVTIAFDDGENPRRTLAVAPASFALGSLFLDTAGAALAKMQADQTKELGSGEAFLLEYRVTSSQGGRLSFGVKGDAGKYSLVLDVATPKTSLTTGRVGQAAEQSEPYDTVAGTVWFHMSKDDFDFFVDRAYGAGATSKQNFTDFALVPHEWLRLTVEPRLEEQLVNVGFELLTVDQRRVAIAKAPASILAGKVFQTLVDRNMTTMLAQEKASPGSSTPWQAPFYYDSPEDGGVVQVIAQGALGLFSVAYAVESPRHPLVDVPFVEYLPVELPPPSPAQTASCEELGDPSIVLAPRGVFEIEFVASDVIKNSPDLMGPLQGTIYCSLYRASDVKITGPIEGAMAIQDFEVPAADLMAAAAPTFITAELFAGDYQILCAQDLDADGGASKGDPVTIPIGSYPLACNRNPVIVEFGILNPLD